MNKKILAVWVFLAVYALVAAIVLFKPQDSKAATENWSNPATWGGSVPAPGSAVTIPAGKTILLDMSVSVKSIQIDGTLVFANQGLSLTADWIMVHTGGRLEIGTEANPYTNRAIITLTGNDPTQNIMGMGTKMIGVMGGTLEIHGENRTAWAKLNATAPKGATQITLDRVVDWRAGDKIVIASTDYEEGQAEKVTVTGVNGATVTFSEALKNEHFGVIQNFAGQNFDTRAEVGLLSRNITIQGDADSESDGFGGHIMIMSGGKAKVEGMELYRMGQKMKLGRYPIHWHMIGDVNGDYVKNSSVHFTFNRCVTIHGTNKVLVQSNVAYDSMGHCYFLEDGIENKNVFENNLGIRTRKPASADRLLASDASPATYWITNPDNIFRNNVAAGSEGHGFWLAFPQHPTGPSTTTTVFPRQTPFGEFSGNVTHSNDGTGIMLDDGPKPDGTTETTTYNPRAVPGDSNSAPVTANLSNALIYKNRQRGIWTRGYPLNMTGFKFADNPIGATFANSFDNGAYLKGSVFVGETTNKGNPASWETKGLDGRSLPRPWEADKSIIGFEFYDGLVAVQQSTFVNYQSNSQRPAAGIGYLEKNRFSLYPSNFAEGISFINANRVFFLKSQPDRDGDRNRVFMDKDGSITGTAGASVTDFNFFLSTANCAAKTDWNAFICTGNHYGQLYVSNKEATPADIKPLTIWKEEDGGTQTIIGCCEDTGNKSANISIITNKNYMLRFPKNLPQKLELVLRQSPGRWVRVALQYPSANFKVLRYGSTQTAVANLAALDALTKSGYYFDIQSATLHIKLYATSTYEALNIESIAGLPAPGNYFHTLPPARLYDSRVEATAGAITKQGPLATGQVRTIKATGLVGIPAGTKAILANVTVAKAQFGGYLTFYPADSTESNTATVNWYRDGARVVGNFAIIGLSSSGEFKVKAGGATDFIIDVMGYLDNNPADGGVFRSINPANPRLYDSRAIGTGLLGKGQGALTINSGVRTINASGAGNPLNIPSTAKALVANVTVADTISGGYVTLFPSGGTPPTVSTVNWNARGSFPNVPKDIANLTIVPVNNGQISMVAGGAPGSGAGAEVIIDVLGYIDGNTAGGTLFNPLYTPLRLYDSRTTVANLFAGSLIKGVVPANNTRQINIGGAVSVPTNAVSAIVRITTVDVGGGGYIAVYPADPHPGNSNVNTTGANQQNGNVAIVALNNGTFMVKNGGASTKGFIIDVIGYIVNQ